MKLFFLLLLLPLALFAQHEVRPKYLYKITTMHNWTESQGKADILLLPEDHAFIHLATESQIEHVLSKFWSNYSDIVLLKLDSAKLVGHFEYETNPGGTNRYYHLYHGAIPHNSVVEAKILHRDEAGAWTSY